tara:strand:+ start:525 stop:866 length:342 start_codon:yes stop_codon:yes gene_type:complete
MNKISGVGIDIVDVKRFRQKKYEDNKKFYKKIFVKSEIDYCLKFKKCEQHFAGKFAIKEAIKKSIIEQIDFLEIITKHKNSKPIVELKINNSCNFFVSVSHEKDYAIAIVIKQ